MSRRPAFALLPVLAVSWLCLAVALLCHSAASVAASGGAVAMQQARARLAALASARLGCARVAQCLGPDRRWSGMSPAGCWFASHGEAGWRREVLDGSAGALAWRVRDLSCSPDLSAGHLARERAVPLAREPRMRQRLAAGSTQPEPLVAALSAARVGDEAALRDFMADLPAGVTVGAGARSLLIDPSTGRWRENLSEPGALGRQVGPSLASALLDPPPELRASPVRGSEPRDVAGAGFRLRHAPVVTDLALSLGVFNARSDGRHRVRLHAQMTLWNPASLGLITSADKRLFLAEVEGAPEVTVVNLDSGARLGTWLDAAPPGVFWGYTQGVRERGLWWWVEVLDSTRHGMLRSGLLPGEVYSLLMPDPSAQPYGLARVIGRETWRYDTTDHPHGWVRPSPEVFLPNDRILITARFVTPGTTLRLRPYAGPLDASTEAAAYASPALVVLTGIQWPDARIELTGAEYSRPDSNGYVVGERRFRWRARLLAHDSAEARAILDMPGLARGCVDLSDALTRPRWALTTDAAAEALDPVEGFAAGGQGFFRDSFVNRHEASVDGAFADLRLRDVPVDPPLDGLSLHSLRDGDQPMPVTVLDGGFFAAPAAGTDLPISENPRLVPWTTPRSAEEAMALRDVMRGPQAAEALALEGGFNINTTDPLCWEAWLGMDRPAWTAAVGGPASPGKITGRPLFFTQPAGSHAAKHASAAQCDVDDEGLALLGAADLESAANRQSARGLGPEALRRFSECLAAEIGRRETPLAGLSELMRSGAVDRAIAESRVDDGLPQGGPLRLDASSMLGAHASMLVARGDTFVVTGLAPEANAGLALELTIQRVPAVAARPHLGRRFIVTRARWVDPSAR